MTNTVPKYVVSTTLSRVDEWQPATLLKGDVSQEIAQLRQQPGKNMAHMEVSHSFTPCSNRVFWMSSCFSFSLSWWGVEGVSSKKEIASRD